MTTIRTGLATAALVALLLTPAAASAATVYIPEGSAGEILVVDADTGAVKARWTGFEAVHGLAGAPGAKYLVAGSYTEVAKDEAEVPEKPEGITQDEHEAHHARKPAPAMPMDAPVSILTVLDAQSGEVVRRIEVPGAVHHVAMSPDGRHAVTSHPTTGGIGIVDLDTLSFRIFVPTGPNPNYAVFAPDGRSVFVTNADNGTVSEVDIEKGFVKRNILSGEAPEHVVISRDGEHLYVADAYAGDVHEIALPAGRIARTFPVGGEIHGLDLSDDGETLFVSGKGEDKLVAVALDTGTQKTTTLAPSPYHLATVTSTGALFVSSREEPKVWIVGQSGMAVRGEIAVSGEGHQMVVLP
ncbi:YncE family protein [Chelativorans xinjiangense]|uniref:YncE family protein n=1 Tax=Chelativorans xinjiangense TaxID=2681485 RepID=UPI00135864ED|nr:YncE family protein [Chelativorans xinjiangense]